MNVGVGGQGSGVGTPISSYRDLRVWQSALELAQQIYRATSGFPREEVFGLSAQLRRAIVSVPSNIAEGHTRESTRDYLHHLSYAQGSLAEVETQVELAARLGYLEPTSVDDLQRRLTSVGRQLYALRNAVKRSAGDGTFSDPRP